MKPTITLQLEIMAVPTDCLQPLLNRLRKIDLVISAMRVSLAMYAAQQAMGNYNPADTCETHRCLFEALEIRNKLCDYLATLN